MPKTLMALILVLSGCGGTAMTETEQSSALALCVQPPGRSAQSTEPLVFSDDQAVEMVVRIKGCLSPECDTERMAQCDVALNGSELTVSSEFSWKHSGSFCPTCSDFTTSCTSPVLGRGDYTLVFGGRSVALKVESATAAASQPCINND